MKTNFNLGDKVTWESQAGGSYTDKTGVIVKKVFRDKFNAPWEVAKKYFPDHMTMFDGNSIPGGGNVAYFIEVQAGPRAKPRLYMPYPKKLRLVGDK